MSARRVPWAVDGLLAMGSALYGFALLLIQWAYRMKLLRVHRLPVPVVSVGNLTWGGTGKTPMVIQLAQAFHRRGRSVAILTRGYGKDEALLMRQRLHPIPVLVNPDRVRAGLEAIRTHGADLLLLDDGYQQWRLKKDVEILMIDSTAPFESNRLIPRGTLREPSAAASRAALVVLTKVDRDPPQVEERTQEIRRVNAKAPIFLASYRPVALRSFFLEKEMVLTTLRGQPVATLAGIAQPQAFEETVKGCGAKVVLKYRVPDHHPYTVGELLRFFARCKRHGITKLITTSKDAVRIPSKLREALLPNFKEVELLVLEVRLEFEPHESELHHRIDSLLAG